MKHCLMIAALALPLGPALAQADRIVDYRIAPQAVPDALTEWGRQSGVQLLFPFDAVAGRQSPGVIGRMPSRAALARLIADQPLEVATDTGSSVALRRSRDSDGATVAAQSEIIVTAQRRRERLQDVPISVSALDGRRIDEFRLNNFQDVSRLVPNLLVSSFSPGRPILAIRGATNTFNQIGVDKPVGVIVDDVIISRSSAQTLELFGVESVQVLRGPQGTLFGRNVTGGAIVVDTGRPQIGVGQGRVRAFYGEYDTVELDGLVDVPASDTVAVRLAGLARFSTGWGRDSLNGQRLDNQESYGVRAQTRVVVSDTAELLIAGDISRDETGGRTLSSIGAGDDGNRRTSEAGVPQYYLRRQGGVSMRWIMETGVGELTSITAYRRSTTDELFANVATNFRFLTGNQSQAISDDGDEVGTFTQEVRLASTPWSAGNFLVGVFLLDEDARRDLVATALGAGSGALVSNIATDQRVRSRSAAIFADGTVNLLPILSVSVGGRYTIDTKRASIDRVDRRNAANNFAIADLQTTWREFTPRAVVRLQPNRDLMAYGSWSRGYTAGGYNTEAAVASAFRQPFAPELVENFELGMKSRWFGGTLTLNATAFHMNYRDKQELFFNNVTRVLNIVNAARATVRGFEVEAALKPAAWLSLGANYGHLKTRYDDFIIPGGANNTGNRLGSSPENKLALFGDIRVPLGRGHITGNASYSYTGSYFTGAARDFGLFIDGYALVNASVGYATANDRLQINVFARNLLDKEFLLIPSVQVVRSQYLGPPRVIGVSAGLRF